MNKKKKNTRKILLVFEEIYLCLFTPNCTGNHAITFLNLAFRKYTKLNSPGNRKKKEFLNVFKTSLKR